MIFVIMSMLVLFTWFFFGFGRTLMLILWVVALMVYTRAKFKGSNWHCAAALALPLLTLASPIDVTFKNVPGPPRLVPFTIGLPSKETVAKSKRGDAVLAGCTRMGLEPSHVLVW